MFKIIAIAVLLSLPTIGNAQIYRCTSETGTIIFSEVPCADDADVVPSHRLNVNVHDRNIDRKTNSNYSSQQGTNRSTHTTDDFSGPRQLFSQAKDACLRVISQKLPTSIINICGSDILCLQSEAKHAQKDYKDIIMSQYWIANNCDIIIQIESEKKERANQLITDSKKSSRSYRIEVSHNDDFFIINGEKFKARTYCFNMNEGDKVVFTDGSPLGVCVSATILNLRTEKLCRLWCE